MFGLPLRHAINVAKTLKCLIYNRFEYLTSKAVEMSEVKMKVKSR